MKQWLWNQISLDSNSSSASSSVILVMLLTSLRLNPFLLCKIRIMMAPASQCLYEDEMEKMQPTNQTENIDGIMCSV